MASGARAAVVVVTVAPMLLVVVGVVGVGVVDGAAKCCSAAHASINGASSQLWSVRLAQDHGCNTTEICLPCDWVSSDPGNGLPLGIW